MKDHLHDWIFHYNAVKGVWDATTRENYNSLFNNRDHGILSSKDIWTLIELINRTNGDNLKIKKLTNQENY